MKKFVLFPELLGSDQLFPVDSRWSHAHMCQEATVHARKLMKSRHVIITYGTICYGNIQNPKTLLHFTIKPLSAKVEVSIDLLERIHHWLTTNMPQFKTHVGPCIGEVCDCGCQTQYELDKDIEALNRLIGGVK